MTQKTMVVTAAVALLLFAAGTWQLLLRDEEASTRTPPATTTALGAPRERPEAGAVSSSGGASDRSVLPRNRAADQTEAKPAPVTQRSPTMAHGERLRGVLLGLSSTSPWRTQLVISASPPDELRTSVQVQVDPDGRFEADVAALLAAPSPAALEIVADDPSYSPVRESVATPQRKSVRPDKWSPDQELPFVCINVELATPGTGLVLDESQQPLAGALVGSYALEWREPSGKPLETVTTDANGRFRLRLAWSNYLIVIFKPDAGLRPASLNVTGRLDDTVVILHPGAWISGTVRRAGVESVAGAGVKVMRSDCAADRPARGAPPLLELAGLQLLWRPNSVEIATVVAATDAEGRYRVAGLEPGPYRITLGRLPGQLVHPALARALTRGASAPADRVDLDPACGRLVFAVRGESGPIEGVTVQLQSGNLDGNGVTGGDGRVGFAVTADARHAFSASKPGYVQSSGSLITPGIDQELTLPVFLKTQPPATLRLRLFDAAGTTIERATFFSPTAKVLHAPDGFFEFTGLLADRHRVSVQAGDPGSYFMVQSFDADLPPGQTIEMHLQAVVGGRLRVAARDENGQLLAAHCRVYGPSTIADDVLSARGPLVLDPLFAPGKYRLILSLDGYRSRSVAATVQAETTADVDAVLTR